MKVTSHQYSVISGKKAMVIFGGLFALFFGVAAVIPFTPIRVGTVPTTNQVFGTNLLPMVTAADSNGVTRLLPISTLATFIGSGGSQVWSNDVFGNLGFLNLASNDVPHWNPLLGKWTNKPAASGGGTVTSVALTMPAEFSVSGSPITGAGTFTVTEANQIANTVYAGPTSGGAAAPGFRAMVEADAPAALARDTEVLGWLVDSNYLRQVTSANGAFTSLLQSSNPAVVKTISAGNNVTVTDNGTNAVIAATAGADVDAIHDNVAGEFALVTEKTLPASADLLLIEDSAAANAKKRVQIGNLEGVLESLLDLDQLQGTATDGQLPSSITRDTEFRTDLGTSNFVFSVNGQSSGHNALGALRTSGPRIDWPAKTPSGLVTVTGTNSWSIETNASFTLTLSGTATNGQSMKVYVWNTHVTSDITVTSSPALYVPELAASTNLFNVKSNSLTIFQLHYSTNKVAGGEWYLENWAAFLYALAPSTSINLTTNGNGTIAPERAALTGDVTASANNNATTIAANAVTDTKLRDSAAVSVIGRSANSSGDPADIAAAANGQFLQRSNNAVVFGAIAPEHLPEINGSTAVIKFTDYKDFVYPGKVDGTGCTIVTNDYTSNVWGLASHAGTGGTNVNYAIYRVGTVPIDLDTAVTMTLRNLAFRVAGTDTASSSWSIALFSPASSSGHMPSDFNAMSTHIAFTSGTITSPVANDIFYFGDVTLTGWAGALTAGRPLLIGIARDGADANNDVQTIVGGTIEYGRTK